MAPAAATAISASVPRRWTEDTYNDDDDDNEDDTTTGSIGTQQQHHGVEITLQDAIMAVQRHHSRHGDEPPYPRQPVMSRSGSILPKHQHYHRSTALTLDGTTTTGGNALYSLPTTTTGAGPVPDHPDCHPRMCLWTKTASWTQWMFYRNHHFFATLDDKHDDGFQSEHLGDSRQYWRDIILGVNDGLVSTFLLVAGVTGANLSNKDILLTAIAGTIAGAISMAAGEYIATKTQEEVFAGEVKIERTHIAQHREQELGELRECFAKIGIVSTEDSSINEKEEVEDLNRRLYAFYSKRDHAHLLVHMALEFGILEDEKRNPVIAGSVAFVLFTSGALPSVLPFIVIERNALAFAVAGVLTMTSLFLVGAIKTWATRGNLWHAAIENLAVSAGGGAVAFVVGYAFEQLLGGDGRGGGDDRSNGTYTEYPPLDRW